MSLMVGAHGRARVHTRPTEARQEQRHSVSHEKSTRRRQRANRINGSQWPSNSVSPMVGSHRQRRCEGTGAVAPNSRGTTARSLPVRHTALAFVRPPHALGDEGTQHALSLLHRAVSGGAHDHSTGHVTQRATRARGKRQTARSTRAAHHKPTIVRAGGRKNELLKAAMV